MVIAFGIKSYKIKRFDSQELKLSKQEDKSFTVELRQKYFYLFFIPFFGLGKEWVYLKDGKKYELPVQYLKVLENQNIKINRNWRNYLIMFLGPILILIFALGLYSTVLIQKYISYKSNKDNIEKIYSRLDSPLKNDYYHLISDKKGFIMKIYDLKNDSILFSVPIIDKNPNAPLIIYNTTYIDDTINNPNKKIWVGKTSLKKAYGGKYNYTNKFDGIVIKELNFTLPEKCKLLNIKRKTNNSILGFD